MGVNVIFKPHMYFYICMYKLVKIYKKKFFHTHYLNISITLSLTNTTTKYLKKIENILMQKQRSSQKDPNMQIQEITSSNVI